MQMMDCVEVTVEKEEYAAVNEEIKARFDALEKNAQAGSEGSEKR